MKSLNSEVQENALLESPTGSGKSLSLLCSVIAWHYHRKTLFEKDQNDMVIESKYTMPKITAVPDNSPIPSSAVDFQQIPFPKEAFQVSEEKSVKKLKSVKPPGKVYITSRTHKQISQLVKELRATPYQPKMSVLGSRSHLCLHESVLNSSDSNEECRKLLDTSGCKYFDKAEMLARNMRDTIWDIEDLVEAGRDHRACPYFAARTLSQEADIIFAPYNYVCDPGIRDAMSINLNNAVVVLDEAHNIEDAARESGSFTVDNEKLDLIAIELEGLRASCSKISDGPYAGTAKDLGPCYETMKSVSIVFQFLSLFDIFLVGLQYGFMVKSTSSNRT